MSSPSLSGLSVPPSSAADRIAQLESSIIARRLTLGALLTAAPRALRGEIVTPATLAVAFCFGVLLDRQEALRSWLLMASLQSLGAKLRRRLRAESPT